MNLLFRSGAGGLEEWLEVLKGGCEEFRFGNCEISPGFGSQHFERIDHGFRGAQVDGFLAGLGIGDLAEKKAGVLGLKDDELIESAQQWGGGKLWELGDHPSANVELKELKRKLYRAVMNVNILEVIRFYVSFACSFAFGELKKLEGSAKIISFIARDESQHLAMSQRIINNWKDHENDKEMLKVIKDTEKEVYKMYEDTVDEEKRWATYLFSKGSMIGLSEKLLHQFVEYMANRRMKAIQLTPTYDQKTNPLPWVDHWLNSRSSQNAPQETEIESYVIGGIKQDVTKDQFKSFKL